MRSTTNRNARGGSAERLRRRLWLLETFGDGLVAECALRCTPRCQGIVTADTVTVDRIVPGVEGGTYRRDNIRPACAPCNYSDGGRRGAARRARKPDDQHHERAGEGARRDQE